MKNHVLLGILLLALLLRLYHVDFPVGGWHSWRQADTAAMARNFHESGYRLFYPQIDWGGNSAGIVETEFPVYSYLVALLYSIFGPSEIWGRLLSIACSMMTMLALYLLVAKYISNRVALWSAFVFAILPLNTYYGRTFMPESMMLMCSTLGIYFFTEWLDKGNIRNYLLSACFITLAALIKIPALYLGLPLLYAAWLKFGQSMFRNWLIWLFVCTVFVLVGTWYYHAHQIFLQSGLSFGIWGFGTDKWGNLELLATVKFYNDIIFKSIAERHLTYAGFIPFVVGLFIKRRSRNERIFDFWLIAVVIYFLIVAKGNQVHEYYQLPFILPGVVYIGKSFDRYLALESLRSLRGRMAVNPAFFSICLICMIALSILRYGTFMERENLELPLFKLAPAVQGATQVGDLIIAVNEGDPITLYRSHRKGWNLYPEALDSSAVRVTKAAGAKYIVGEMSIFDTPEREKILSRLLKSYNIVKKEEGYFILSL